MKLSKSARGTGRDHQKPSLPAMDAWQPPHALRRVDGSTVAANPAWSERPIIDLLREQVERNPSVPAIKGRTASFTRSDLYARATALGGLIAGSVAPGAPIAVHLPNDALYPVAVLACLAAGHPCIVLDSEYPVHRNQQIITHSGAAAIIAEPGSIRLADLPLIPLSVARMAELGVSVPATPAGPDEPAVIIYTSGSTGDPKGIALSQRAILHRAGQMIESLQIGGSDISLPLGSPCTVAGLLQTVEALLAGAVLIKADVRRAGLNGIMRLIAQEKVTALFGTPALLRALCRLKGAAGGLATLRALHPSGDVLLSADVELFRSVIPDCCVILAVYGLTEAPAICQWFVSPDAVAAGRMAAGDPVPGYEWAIVDDAARPVASGETGELVVRSRYTAIGDWSGGKLSPGPFLPDPAQPDVKILHTGDLARVNADQSLTVIGRKDRQVQINGMRVEPYEIECSLRACPDVLDAAVAAGESPSGPDLVAFVVLDERAGAHATEAVRQHLTRTLPRHMWPGRIVPIASLPFLPGFKIDNETLRSLAAAET